MTENSSGNMITICNDVEPRSSRDLSPARSAGRRRRKQTATITKLGLSAEPANLDRDVRADRGHGDSHDRDNGDRPRHLLDGDGTSFGVPPTSNCVVDCRAQLYAENVEGGEKVTHEGVLSMFLAV